MTKAEALEKIRANIATHGHHIYLVQGGPNPRFVYTIGLSETIGAELIFAGGTFYTGDQVFKILNRLAIILKESPNRFQTDHALGELGTFSLQKVNPTWSSKLILGAFDYYNVPDVPALQGVPDAEHRTIDVPDLSQVQSEVTEPIWQWLNKAWEYPIAKNSIVMTDMDALRGAPITEAARWEENAWELFPGCATDVDEEDARAVPFGTLLGADPSLRSVTELAVGKALRRNPGDLEWSPWGSSSSDEDE